MSRRGSERRLATVLFVDVVDSTRLAAEVGDRRWRELVRQFRRSVRGQLRAHGGREEDTAGDGFFATFSRPAAAIRAASAIVQASQALGIDVRCGVHMGELERIEGHSGGIAAHIGARVMGQAGPAEVLVTGTVHDLVVGSGISFAVAHETELRGVPGRWTLHRVTDIDGVALPTALGPHAVNMRLGGGRPEPAVPAVALVVAVLAVSLAAVMGAFAMLQRADPSVGGAPTPGGGASAAPTATHDISMLRIDPETNEVAGEVRDKYRSAYAPAPLAVVDGTLWQETPINLVRRDLATGQAEDVIPLPEYVSQVDFGFGSLWLVNYDSALGRNWLDRVDPVSGRTIASFELGGRVVLASAVGRDAIWILKVRELIEISPDENSVVDRDVLDTATIPESLSVVGDTLWICECSEGRLIPYDADADRPLGVPVEFAQRGVVLPEYRFQSQGAVSVDEGTMWLMDAGGATVTPLDARTGEPAGPPMGIPPRVSGHVFGFGSLWLAAGRVVHRIELEHRHITEIPMPDGVLGRGIALDEPAGVVWVSNCREGFVMFGPGCES